jgi:hypothetical protein
METSALGIWLGLNRELASSTRSGPPALSAGPGNVGDLLFRKHEPIEGRAKRKRPATIHRNCRRETQPPPFTASHDPMARAAVGAFLFLLFWLEPFVAPGALHLADSDSFPPPPLPHAFPSVPNHRGRGGASGNPAARISRSKRA